MNKRLIDFNMSWQSDVTSIVQMMYNEKKDVFGDKYNFCGWDYYRNGVFELLGHQNSTPETTTLTKSFDWRSRHGANCPENEFYYDGDEFGSGWLTDVREQGDFGTCWAFSANGAVEARFNLYNNSHLDFNLSVKEYICCDQPAGNWNGGYNVNALKYLKDHDGVPTEHCYPYWDPPPKSCDGKCETPDTIYKIGDYSWVNFSHNDLIKTAVIQNGPLSVAIPDLHHALVLNGFTFKDDYTIWIFKNSWGETWGNHGFGYFKDYQGIMDEIYKIHTPQLYINNILQDIDPAEPFDYDSDGYCNWGIGPAPENYPNCTNLPEDCDDSNPYLGPYDGAYNCTCLLEFDPEIEEIDYEGHWDTPRAIDQIIEISSGWGLEITSTVYFGPGTKIIIKPGARLVINGGKLTKACNELWDGIEVHGQPLFRQTPEYQGLIDIKNGGTIEFSKTAIITGKKDNGIIINGFEGGIIIAENATFRDNEIDIEMLPYRDNVIVPPFTLPNQSRFKECAFITDALLYEYSTPSAHIHLEGIYGLQITSCEFKNDVGFEKWTVNHLGTGIYSFNSTFLLKRVCSIPSPPCPEEYLIPCRFEGLNYGIRAFNWSGINNLSINKVNFVNNVVGIYLSGVDQAEITRNTFNCITNIVGGYDGSFLGGIYLDDCTGYKVEENSIYGTLNIEPRYEVKSIGIYIKNSGTDDNEIYNNSIHDQYIAIQAEGINRGDRTGLCLKCNKLIANKNDFVVSPDQRIQSLSWGIKELQGTFKELSDAPAGNEFREYSNEEIGVNNNGILKNWNYYNDGNHVTYIQHVTPPYKYKPGDHNYYNDNTFRRYQTDIPYDEINSCPSHIQNPIYKDSYDPRLTMENAAIQAAFYQSLLDTLIDGGDTYSLNQDVLTGLPNEALELCQRLINESPYLSDTVIKSAIYKENVLPNAMIRDVMVLNPQTVKSNEFINLLDYRMVPMSDTMLSEILEGQNILGSKEILESHLSYWKEKKASARNDLIRLWLSDTTIYHPGDSLIELYQNENDIDAIYRLASCFTNYNQFTEALSTLQLIPTVFQLTLEQEYVYQDYLAYFNIVKMMNDSLINAYALDSTSISELAEIMDHGYPQVGGYARGLLVNGNYLQFYETVAAVGEYKSSKTSVSGYKRPDNKINDHFRVFPNPATDFIIADFNTLDQNAYGVIRIVDINGKLCKAIPLMKYQDQIVINLSNLTSGTYTVMLWIDNKPIESEKLIKVNE